MYRGRKGSKEKPEKRIDTIAFAGFSLNGEVLRIQLFGLEPLLGGLFQAGDVSMSGKRDLNPRPPPWQGGALPLSYSRSFFRLSVYRYPNLRAEGLEPPRLGH